MGRCERLPSAGNPPPALTSASLASGLELPSELAPALWNCGMSCVRMLWRGGVCGCVWMRVVGQGDTGCGYPQRLILGGVCVMGLVCVWCVCLYFCGCCCLCCAVCELVWFVYVWRDCALCQAGMQLHQRFMLHGVGGRSWSCAITDDPGVRGASRPVVW